MDVQTFGLGPRLDTSGVPDNPWLAFLEHDARTTISLFARDVPVAFAMTESHAIQALASFEPPVVLVSWGLADAICRFCARLVTAGMFVAFGETRPEWKPSVDNTFEPIRGLLDEPFRWHGAYLPWIDDGERVALFVFLIVTVHRFVVLHEVGHVMLRHGVRDGDAGVPVVDGAIEDLATREATIASQAKELAADAYAVNSLFRLLEVEFRRDELDPLRAMVRQRMMGDAAARLRMVLFAAYATFQILDRRDWSLRQAMRASHPPAPARVKAVYATVLEMDVDGLDQAGIATQISLAHSLSQAILSAGFDAYPDLDWVRRLDDPEFDAFMLAVVAEIPRYMGD